MLFRFSLDLFLSSFCYKKLLQPLFSSSPLTQPFYYYRCKRFMMFMLLSSLIIAFLSVVVEVMDSYIYARKIRWKSWVSSHCDLSFYLCARHRRSLGWLLRPLPFREAMWLWQMARQWTSSVKSIVVPPWCELMCSLASLCLGDWSTQGQIPEHKTHTAFLQCCVWHVSELPCQIAAADMSGSNSQKQNLVCSHIVSLWRFSKVSNYLIAL